MLLSRIARVPICLQIGHGGIGSIEEILYLHNLRFSDYVVVTTDHLWKAYGGAIKVPIKDVVLITASDVENAASVEERLRLLSRNILVLSIGGGKVIDTTKFVVARTGHSYLSIPTTLSNDGIYSPVAVITQKGGKLSSGASIPIGIVVDLEVVSKAPPETIISGVGDLVSNVSALSDWESAAQRSVEKIDGFSFALSNMAAYHILSSGVVDISNSGFLKRLAHGLIMSGLSMELAGSSRPCSGSEHMFSHAIDYLYPDEARPHGIQVAFGTLIMERLRGHEISELVTFYKKLGLPTTIKELGLSREFVVESLLYAPNTRDRYTVLDMSQFGSGIQEVLSEF
jgi:glycerol-1-phosphate dehydrogenase [NAD(P)+]